MEIACDHWGNRSANSMAKRLGAGFQSRIGNQRGWDFHNGEKDLRCAGWSLYMLC